MKSPLVLATDLDGTWLHGSEEERYQLYTEFDKLRERQDVFLIYLTERELGFVKGLIQGNSEGSGKSKEMPFSVNIAVPVPDLIIHNIGGGMYSAENTYRSEIYAYNESVNEKWKPKEKIEEAKLQISELAKRYHSEVHIYPQSGKNVRINRLAYFVKGHAETVREEAYQTMEQLGFDTFMGSDTVYNQTYLDVLPKGVNKDSALRSALSWIEPSRLLFVGDALHDDAVFEQISLQNYGMDALGVLVSNANPELINKYQGRSSTIQISPHEGMKAVIYALNHLFNADGNQEERGFAASQ